jgi:hypothetical protein
MMRDYIIKIKDIPPWRAALRAEAEAKSPYAYIDDNDEAKLNLAVTGVIAQIGNATVSICRLNDDEHQWLTGLTQVQELGSADKHIREINDINWINSGKGLYHAIHLQTDYDIDDGDGGTITVTPPLLHCIFA